MGINVCNFISNWIIEYKTFIAIEHSTMYHFNLIIHTLTLKRIINIIEHTLKNCVVLELNSNKKSNMLYNSIYTGF